MAARVLVGMNLKQKLGRSLGVLVFAAVLPLGASPLEVSRIPADTKWLMHVDFDAMRGTEVGRRVGAEVESRHGAQVRAFKRMFSVDVLKDLRGMTLFGNGRKDEAVVIVDGVMDRAHLEDVVAAAEGYRAVDHGKFKVHSWRDKGKDQHAAFFSDRLLVFSEREGLLRLALDAMDGGASMPEVEFFNEGPGKPVMVAMARLREIEMDGNEAELLRRANTLKMAMGESDGRIVCRMAAVTDDAATGKRVRRVLDGLLAIAELDENLAGKMDLQSVVKPLAGADGAVVEMDMPVADLLGIMEKVGILTR